ncbi:hypothetical protein F2Q70_00003273 [Brassica cretica]|uniref:Uncharacterized protein n=1 Tax=Brassica cretica TaxID=69181 RepID=A0A3N6S1F0_BRACR|nr:hypothetical protein F2Q70_00003273 [Brassica cretica]KAF3563469.1 hypothetical protein DY000_02015007 [Brassica cretica]
MPSSNKSKKEQTLLFSDPANLEHSIHREKRTASIDNSTRLSTKTIIPPTVHTHPISIIIPPHTSIDTELQDMVVTIVLIQDATGNLHDQEGHLRNAAGQKIDDQGVVIPDTDVDIAAAQAVGEAARPRTLNDYNRPDSTTRTNLPSIHQPFKGKTLS